MNDEELKTLTDNICKKIWEILTYCEKNPKENKKLQLWLVIHQELQKIVQ